MTTTPPDTAVATRRFAADDQLRFANLSGDRNPMHFDPVLARRTQAGRPVVHGVHLLLWALDELATALPSLPPLRRLKVRFAKFVPVDSEVTLTVPGKVTGSARLSVSAAGVRVAQITIEFGALAARASPDTAETGGDLISAPDQPCDLTMGEMATRFGRLACVAEPQTMAAMFPAAVRWVGGGQVAALLATTLLVGMVCPGLHSIYGGLELEACETSLSPLSLGFRVVETDPEFSLVRLAVSGGGWAGSIDSFLRPPPIMQPAMAALAGLVGVREFAGSRALVIGGSRGLGELTAKLLACGGAEVAISYRIGQADAEAVAEQIRAAGGKCDLLTYDTALPAEPQLQGLAEATTHAYYFATPSIFQQGAALFDQARHAQFFETYVTGFWNLAHALHTPRRTVSLFYPSSEAVQKRPKGMLEYAMAKAAGEQLCTELNLAWAPLRVIARRLPRLPTDQTATLARVPAGDALDQMLHVVREVQAPVTT